MLGYKNIYNLIGLNNGRSQFSLTFSLNFLHIFFKQRYSTYHNKVKTFLVK